MKKKSRKAFWHNIKFKYKLTIINENTLEEVVGIHVSKLNGLSVIFLTCTIIFLVAGIIIVFTPLRNYLPGYMNPEIRRQVVENRLKADSLNHYLERQTHYVMNIQDIISGHVNTDTVQSIDSLTTIRAEQLMERSKEEEEFRKQYEVKEQYNLRAVVGHRDGAGLIFYRPTRGIKLADFNQDAKHYGIDLLVLPSESILSTLDGTVVFAGYTADAGYMIQLQHTQNFISVYKYCGRLLKKAGDKVKGGEVIAIGGKPDSDKNSPRMHFELWHRGNPIHPEKYVVF